MEKKHNRKKLGTWGEEVAAHYLVTNGYQLVTRNFRCIFGEMDLIAKDHEVWCFIEVKTRRNANYGKGYQAITKTKQQHLILTAQNYLSLHNLGEVAVRFDVVSIDFTPEGNYQIELIKNALQS